MKSLHVRKHTQFLAVSLFFILSLALIAPAVFAHIVTPDTFVRVVSANPDTRTYTFSCRVDPENDFLRDWFIRPDDGNTADDPNEAAILDKKSGEFMTYTFNQNTFYHIGCYIWNPFGNGNPANDFRGDIHIDLRQNTNSWNPQIAPLSGNGLTATYECRYSGAGYSASWEVINAQTHERKSIGSGKTITHTVSGHGLYDYICNIADANGVKKSTGLPVEYFDQGAPYFPDKNGVPDGIKNTWNRDGTAPTPSCTPATETCNSKDDDCDGQIDENNVCSSTPPPSNTGCFNSIQNIPATCEGTISSDSMVGGCRVIGCSRGSSSMQIKACDKPDGTTPQFFEMYRQSFVGNPLKICIGSSCMKNEGYIKSPLYPICTGTAPTPSCTPATETCNSKDDDCDGLIDENNVCSPPAAPPSNDGCFSSIQNIPATCEGTISSDSMVGGCRVIGCNSGSNSMQIKACDKPDGTTPQFFEMYRQSFVGNPLKICIGSSCMKNEGYIKSPLYPICTGTAPTPSCTPATETCNSKDDDCDGLIDENNVCSPPAAPPSNDGCFSSIQNIPATCEGTISSDSMVGGCRVIGCNSGSNSMQIKACDKPDGTTPQFFEMYRQTFTGMPLKICIGSSCMKNEGYIKSPLYPICTGTAPPPSCTPATETCNSKDDDCDGLIDENNVCSPPPSNTTQCFNTLQSVPVKCNSGTISEDTFSGCRAVTCGIGTSSLKILACNKPDGTMPQFFEMYKQNEAGTIQLEVCLGNTCIKDNGYAKSGAYPICTANAGGEAGGGTGINSPPNAPTWLEPSTTIPIDTFDFHIQIFPMQDAENDAHVASDFEMYDAVTNERVWSRLHQGSPLIHVHNFDGNFDGNLANNDRHLLFNHDYKLRARFYENANGIEQASQWSEWRPFHTKSQANGTTTTSPSLVNTFLGWAVRNGYGLQLVASGVSVPVNVVIAPEIYIHLPEGQRPLLYFTQLYGQVGMIRKDGTYMQYASNLLNYQSFGSLPGSGETGVDGIYVDPSTGDLFVSMVYHDAASSTGYFGKVVRFFTNSNGDGFTSTQTILSGIPVSPSHHVHQITRGPDGKLYMGVGDADDPFNAKNTNVYSAKILRFNDDGSNPGDNPFGTLVWAAGFRNAFGTAWRPGTNELFATNNGPDSDDGIYRVTRGNIFGWCCSTSSGTWHLWPTTTAPVQAAFDAGSSGYPSDSMGSLYVGLSGSTYSQGPDPISKRIVQFALNPDGTKKSVSDFAVYTGGGFSAPIGLAFGPDGLYFTDIYGEEGFTGAGQTKGNIYRIKFGASSSTAPPTSFSVAFGPGRWYPKGLEMVWECKQSNGIGPFKYDFVFGDGQKQTNMDSFSTYHRYAAEGMYTASCTVRDLANGKSASATTTITLKNCTSADFQCTT